MVVVSLMRERIVIEYASTWNDDGEVHMNNKVAYKYV